MSTLLQEKVWKVYQFCSFDFRSQTEIIFIWLLPSDYIWQRSKNESQPINELEIISWNVTNEFIWHLQHGLYARDREWSLNVVLISFILPFPPLDAILCCCWILFRRTVEFNYRWIFFFTDLPLVSRSVFL